MNETVRLAKENNVLVGAHPSLPDKQGWGRREMVMEPVRQLMPMLCMTRSEYIRVGRTGVVLHLPGRRPDWVPPTARRAAQSRKSSLQP